MTHRLGRLACLVAAALLAAIVGTGEFSTRATGPELPYHAVMVQVASDSGSPANVPNVPADITPAELARRLVEAPDLLSAVAATQEALARGGVTTIGDGSPYMRAVAPQASMTVMVPETARLAIEARRRANEGMLTAAELGQMLEDFGWQFPAGSDPGQKVMALLQGWVSEAQKAPSDPLSFTPLFLQAMASRQDPPVDLAAGTGAPGLLRLTALEIELFGAAFDRGLTSLLLGQSHLVEQLASAPQGPCSFIKESTGKIGVVELPGQITDVAVGEAIGRSLEAGLKRAGLSGETAGELGNALSAVGTAMRLWKLVEMYRSGNVQVVAIERNLHKPVEQEDIDVAFQATAGVSDADWEAYQEKLGKYGAAFNTLARDCLSSAGLPAVPDLSDLAADVENWRVEWSIVEGSPEHALVSPRNIWNDENGRPLPGAGRLEKPLARNGDYSATADFLVNILPETKANHEGGGPLTVSPVTVKASLKTSGIPSLSTFVNGAKGGLGLVDAIVELAAGWFQAMVTPKSYATVEVEYESSDRYLLDFDTQLTATADDGRVAKMHVRALGVPITLGLASGPPVSRPLQLLSVSWTIPGCLVSTDVHPSDPFIVHAARLVSVDRDGTAEVADVELNIDVGDLTGTITIVCGYASDGTVPFPDKYLSVLFYTGHDLAREVGSRIVVGVTGWDFPGGSVFATKTYSRSGYVAETTTLTLRRAPQ